MLHVLCALIAAGFFYSLIARTVVICFLDPKINSFVDEVTEES